jgi:hypothetical protein
MADGIMADGRIEWPLDATQYRFPAKMEERKGFKDLLTESQGRNLAKARIWP